MKLLVFACLFLARPVHAQDIPKHTNTILVTGISFKTAGLALINAGYFIDKQDSIFGTLITLPQKNIYHNTGNLIIRVRIKDSIALITGTFNIPAVDGKDYNPVEYRGMKKSAFGQAFAKLNDFSLSLKNKITYSIVP